MTSLPLLIASILFISHTYTEIISCGGGVGCDCNTSSPDNQCTLQCIGIKQCEETSFTCRANDSCQVACIGNVACIDSIILGATATDLTVIFAGSNAGKNINIICGTGICRIDCLSERSCQGISVTNSSTSYNCNGYCEFQTNTHHISDSHSNTSTATSIYISDIPTVTPIFISGSNSVTTDPPAAASISPTETPSINPSQTETPTINPSQTPTINQLPIVDVDIMTTDPLNNDEHNFKEEFQDQTDIPLANYLAVTFISLLCLVCIITIYSIIRYFLQDLNNTIHLLEQVKDAENRLIIWNQEIKEKRMKRKLIEKHMSTNDQKTNTTEELEHEHKHNTNEQEQEQKYAYDTTTQTAQSDLSFHGVSHMCNPMTDESTHNTNGESLENSNVITKQTTDTNDTNDGESNDVTKPNTGFMLLKGNDIDSTETNNGSNTILRMTTTDSQIIAPSQSSDSQIIHAT